jgi:hypothetical protein
MTGISHQNLLILAIVLIVIGAVLLYAPIPYPAGTIGNILIIIGIIVLVIWIVLMVFAAIRHPNFIYRTLQCKEQIKSNSQ